MIEHRGKLPHKNEPNKTNPAIIRSTAEGKWSKGCESLQNMTDQCQYAGWSCGRISWPTKKSWTTTKAGSAPFATSMLGDRAAIRYASTGHHPQEPHDHRRQLCSGSSLSILLENNEHLRTTRLWDSESFANTCPDESTMSWTWLRISHAGYQSKHSTPRSGAQARHSQHHKGTCECTPMASSSGSGKVQAQEKS